ncbi:MAG: response regulator [Verrucomicrobiales bacterium]|nr:response regulator [Verrucomicrobiales bacterium]
MSATRILIVEDEEIVAMDIEARLGLLGYEVAGNAATGERAVALAQDVRPDLVLMDIRLRGEMDGITAAGIIRHRFSLPVVFLTAHSEATTLERAKVAVPFGYILKPFEDRELRTTIEMALYQHAAERAILHLNRLYAVLIQVNQSIFRSLDSAALCAEVCDIAVQYGGFPVAWFGEYASTAPAEGEGGRLVLRALSAKDDALRPALRSVLETQVGAWFPAIEWHDRRVVHWVSEGSARSSPDWEALSRQCGACEALAAVIRPYGIPWGVLCIHASEAGFFGAKEKGLIEEVARDVAYAMENLDREAKRQRAEEALLRERNYLRQILDAQFGFVVVVGLDGAVLDINQTCLQLLGLARGEVLGRSIWDLGCLDAGGATQVREAVLAAGAGRTIRRDMVARFTGADPRDVDLVFSPLRDATGRIIHVVGVGVDITERKRSEEALLMQERRFRSLLETTHDAIMVWNPIRGVEYLNPAAETLTGLKCREVPSRDLAAVLRAQSEGELAEALRAFQADGSWTGDLRLVGSDGVTRHVASRWSTLTDVHGGQNSILITCNDITEQKRLEAQYLRAQRLESVGTLAGGVAHDLNNILSPILMGLDMLNLSTTNPGALNTLDMIKESARRGVDTVRQLLTFSRGGTESHRGPVNSGHLVEEIVRLLRQTLPKSIQIHAEVMDDSATVFADPSQVHQVLLNLCVNARDAMPEGGLLCLRVAEETFGENGVRLHPKARPIRYVVFSVSDSGTGIPPEILDRIFDPFFTTKPHGQGTGLGLATVLGIVESHGGFVLVESVPGSGTTFRVYLPAAKETGPSAPGAKAVPVPESAPRGQGELVLIVDDEPAILQLAAGVLRHGGYRSLTTSRSSEALRLMETHGAEIRAVLTDMMMPFGDGRQLIAMLADRFPDLPILAMSGLPVAEVKRQALGSGASGFLGKPFDAEQLLRVMDQWVRKNSD